MVPSYAEATGGGGKGQAFTFATIEENGELDYGSHGDPYATPSLVPRVESNGK